MSNLLIEALNYAKRGWYVFPCREKPGQPFTREGETITPAEKTPYTAKGLDNATLDEDQIKAWWNKWENALIGINAGKSGLFVIDIDRKHVNGLDTFTTWNVNDSAGLHSMTPSGGMHIVFTGTGKSSTNAKTGIDTRGEGGYFIAPPSKILQGEYTGEYKAFDDWSKTPGIIPDGLMAKLFPDKTVEYVKGNVGAYGERKQLSRTTLTFLVDGAMPGERNSTLFKVLADFVGCGYDKDEIRNTVLPVCVRIGLSKAEFEQVLEHAFSKPRTPSVPETIQEKILTEGKKNVGNKITFEEQCAMEDALLACMIADNSFIPVINDILSFEDFQVFKNRVIYKAISKLYNTGIKVDYITLSNEVSKESSKITLDDISRMVSEYKDNAAGATDYAYIIREKSAYRKLEVLLDNKARYIKSTKNFASTINSLESDVADIAIYGGARTTNILTGKQATDMVTEKTRMIISGEIEQLKTGFVYYDDEAGLFPTELIVCAGRSGEGKSALSLSIINNIAFTQNKPVALFSLEMSTHECVCRLISQLTGLPFKKVYRGKLTEDQWKQYKQAVEKIADSKIYFDDGANTSVVEIRSKIRKLMEKDIGLVVIDQLEQIHGFENEQTHLRLDKIAYAVKAMAKEFDLPIILNHQLNRSITDRRLKNPEPQLSDLNQAGEKPADQVWVILHRRDEQGKKILQSKVKMLKNRNGAKIEFPVIFLEERMLFANPTREEDMRVFQSNGHMEEDGADSDLSEPMWSKDE